MQLDQYTQARANKLSKLAFPDSDNSAGLKIHWVRWISFENSGNVSRQKHKHSFYEAHFVLNGSNDYNVSEVGEVSLREGDGIIISPEATHRVTGFNETLSKISITFALPDNQSFFSKTEQKNAIRFNLNSEIISELNGILTEADRPDGFSTAIIRNRIFNILCSVSRLEPRTTSAELNERTPSTDIRVNSAKQYIDDNKNLFLTCDDVARYCHFNTKYLNRIFKSHTGQTLLEYIHEVKQKEAERLLRESDLTLPEISRSLGFANEYYFNSFFKRATTLSPGAYRRIMARKSSVK